jgi:DNA repair photolyase
MKINEIQSKSILTPASGFITKFTHTLNPYAGCAFGCSYCYVRQMPIALYREEEWGTWLDIKKNAADLLPKEIKKAKKKGPVTIFMSSATDPYQPIEYKARITRSLLEAMLIEKPDFLFVQTRSPLCTRDMDLFQQFGQSIRVSMTIETDLEYIRKAFTPSAPPIPARLKVLKQITDAGVPTQVAIAPLLPCSKQIAKTLRRVTNRAVIDNFFMGDGSRGKRTEKMGIRKIYERLNLLPWYHPNAYKVVLKLLQQEFEDVELLISQQGFMPNQ